MTDVTVVEVATEIQVVEVSTSDNISVVEVTVPDPSSSLSVVEVTIPGPQGPAGGGSGVASLTPWTENVDANGFNLLFDDGTGILSSETGTPELLLFSSVASAVNYLSVTNAATGFNPSFTAAGDDTDLGIDFNVKGNVNDPFALMNFNIGNGDNAACYFQSTGSGSNGPIVNVFQNSSSPAVGDRVGGFQFEGNTDAAALSRYASVFGYVVDPTNGSADGTGVFYARTANSTFRPHLQWGPGVLIRQVNSSTPAATMPGVGKLGFDTSGTGIVDSAANELLLFTHTASAVNYVTISNAATGTTWPLYAAAGDDASIGLRFAVKGSPGYGEGVSFDLGGADYASMTFTGTSAGIGGPFFQTYHNSASAAAGDEIGGWEMDAKDSLGNLTPYGQMCTNLLDATNGSEDGAVILQATVAGSQLVVQLQAGNGVIIGTGGSLYPGTGNLAFADLKGIFDGAGNEQLLFDEVTSAVNYLQIANAATGTWPIIAAAGDDANVGLTFDVKGTPSTSRGGQVNFDLTDNDFGAVQISNASASGLGPGVIFFCNDPAAAATNQIGYFGADGTDAAGTALSYSEISFRIIDPTVGSTDGETRFRNKIANVMTQGMIVGDGVIFGTSTSTYPGNGNIAFNGSKGIFDTSGNEQLIFPATASAVNYLQITNAATGTPPTISAQGDDANVPLHFAVKGSLGLSATLLSNAMTFDLGSGDQSSSVFYSTAGTGNGAQITMLHQSASPAAGDFPGAFEMWGMDSGGNIAGYAAFWARIADPTNLSEDGQLQIYVTQGGTQYNAEMAIGGGVVLGDYTATFAGSGNLGIGNGKGIFDLSANEQLLFTTTASAVNYLQIANAATGTGPVILAAGSDANVDVEVRPKANGNFIYRSVAGGASGAFLATNDNTLGTPVKQVFKSRAAGTVNSGAQIFGGDGDTSFAGWSGARYSSNVFGARNVLGKSRGTSFNDFTVVLDGDTMGEFLFNGTDGTDWECGAAIRAEVDGTPGNNDMPGRLVLSTTADGSNTTTDRMIIKADGGVIIGNGTTSPGSTGSILIEKKFVTANPGTLTIATGAVTATGSYHPIDTEAAAATDDLDTVNGGVTGMRLVIRAVDSTHTVVAKDGTGNLQLAGDFTMDNAQDTLELIYDGSNWLELGRSDNGA